ncbi:hypothetical protein NP493_349g00005 [Ridgeia piscesae]|uniref:Uncharacterized protein n=1 Tax=Ridgeia piscesae TaxID=27915 RepID=A0AAD9NW88_RIDPI|nr:hypothetical protein NP493_349g00005 [Ridgeia piscesae]
MSSPFSEFTTTAYCVRSGDENSYVDLPSSESRALGGLFNVQRRRNWCARWGDYCVRDAKVKLARCCTGLRCMCSELWRRGCVCRQPPTFG